jgi:hypothetical protein
VRRPIQVFATEHFVRTHHPWTCAAAPIHDPRSGQLLGVIDVSGPASTVHASTLALVDAVTRRAEDGLRTAHRAELARVRVAAVPLLARLAGAALATDRRGWVAAASRTAPVDRLALPESIAAGVVWLPAFGRCTLEPLPGGWLVRLGRDEAPVATAVELDLQRRGHGRLVVTTASDRWDYNLSPRHADILRLLATHRGGRTAAELATDLFGDAGNTVTVRAEMSPAAASPGWRPRPPALPLRRPHPCRRDGASDHRRNGRAVAMTGFQVRGGGVQRWAPASPLG